MRKIATNEPASSIRLLLERAHLAGANARIQRDLARIRVSILQTALASSPSPPACTCSRSPIRGYARPDEPCPAHLAEAEVTTRGTRDRLCELLAGRDRTIDRLKREQHDKDGLLEDRDRTIARLQRALSPFLLRRLPRDRKRGAD
jgi:hypothetical protein